MGDVREIDIDRDLADHCEYVDALLARSLRKGRCSRLLRNQLVVFSANIAMGPARSRHWFDPAAVCETVAVLEGSGSRDITKGPSRFTKGPLRGLEYKHFFQASFMAQNLVNESSRAGADLIYRKLIRHHGSYGAVDGRLLTEEDIGLIADAFVTDGYKKRAAQRAKGPRWGLTGEHLIFARARGVNRYLFVAAHTAEETALVDSVRACLEEFPEVAAIAPSLPAA